MLRHVEKNAAIGTAQEHPEGLLRGGHGGRGPREARERTQTRHLVPERTGYHLSQTDNAPLERKTLAQAAKRRAGVGFKRQSERERSAERRWRRQDARLR